jgi:acetyltransferase-like isoleucine patch superfamily enzyme
LSPSIIQDNVIVDCCTTILPNVVVGKKSVIVAGSVVTRDVLAGMVVKGVPAKITITTQEHEAKRMRSRSVSIQPRSFDFPFCGILD